MSMIEASPQREDEVNHPIDAISETTTLAAEAAGVPPITASGASVDELATASSGEQETIIVPSLDNVSSLPEALQAGIAPVAEPTPLIVEAPTDAEAAPQAQTAAEDTSQAEAAPAIDEAAPAIDEATPLLAEDGSDAGLPVRPSVRPPVEEKPAAQAATETNAEAATALALEGDEETAQLARRGRIELLPNEEIVYHLSALYLTNKRVLLYAPSVLRAAFLRDVDAMGMATERLPGGVFILGLVLMVLAALTGGLIYFDAHQELAADSPLKVSLDNVRDFLPLPLEWVALAIALLGLFFVVSYFFYVSKSLFVSVHGRPLITVSVSGYRPRNLDDIDNFINALAGAKDALSDTVMSDELVRSGE